MSFNPLMTLLVRGVSELAPPGSSAIELGNQTFNADNRSLDLVIERSRAADHVDVGQLRALRDTPPDERRDQTASYYRTLGFTRYDSIDVNELYGSLVMDLNRRVRDAYGFNGTYGVVTNNGTGEHVFNQLAVFQNVHDLTAPGGVMVHVMPFVGYLNHGFYGFHPNLYYALALANSYQLITLGVAARTGGGFLSEAPTQTTLPLLLLDNRELPLSLLLVGAKLARRGVLGTITRWVKPADEGTRFAAQLRRLLRERPNLLTFAILRKREEVEFRMPMQQRYIDAIATERLQNEYATRD